MGLSHCATSISAGYKLLKSYILAAMKALMPARKDRSAPKPCPGVADPHATLASLEMLGVTASTLAGVPRNEWRGLQAELDRFYAFGYGGATQRSFLHSPHPKLSGETPAQALRRSDGIVGVRAALRRTLADLR
jgi:hypothetical protein